MSEFERILAALSAIRVPAQPEEYEIHELVGRELSTAGIEYTHECPLMPGRRIDFLCGDVGIEVKKGRPDAHRLLAQATRYLESDKLSSLIVVAQRPCTLPETIGGKCVRVLCLNRLWGVALP